MIASLPVQQQLDLIALHTCDNLAQHDANNALPCGGIGCRVVAGRVQVRAHLQQPLALLSTQGRRLLPDLFLQLCLQRAHGRKRGFPAPLKFAGDEAVIGIDRIISPPCPGCFKACLFSASSAWRRFSLARCSLPVIACTAALMPSGGSSRTTSAPTASSTRSAPNCSSRSRPWCRCS